MCYDVIGVGGLRLKVQIAPDPDRWKTHTVRWSEEGNKWRWPRPFHVGNEEVLHCIPTASASALNETLDLNALSGMELHANLRADLWPADNCGAVLRERSQRFSPGLQLGGLHIIHNRLNTGRSILSCSACAAWPAGVIANTVRKVIKLWKISLPKVVLLETLQRNRNLWDKCR